MNDLTQITCDHEWVASGSFGIPTFVCNRIMWRGYRASVECRRCRVRTWVTLEEWAEIRGDDPGKVRVRHPRDGNQRELWPDDHPFEEILRHE